MVAKTVIGKRVHVKHFGALKEYFNQREFPCTKLLNIYLKLLFPDLFLFGFLNFIHGVLLLQIIIFLHHERTMDFAVL